MQGAEIPAAGGGKDSSRGSGSAVLSLWLQPSLETLSIPSGTEVWGLELHLQPVPRSLLPPPASAKGFLVFHLTSPLAPCILVGVDCFSYLSGGNVSGYYFTLEVGIRGKSDLSLS